MVEVQDFNFSKYIFSIGLSFRLFPEFNIRHIYLFRKPASMHFNVMRTAGQKKNESNFNPHKQMVQKWI